MVEVIGQHGCSGNCRPDVRIRWQGSTFSFFSVGNSRAVAQAAQHKFFRVGIHTITYSDGQMQVMSATSIVVTVSESPLASAGHVELSSDHPEGF